MNYTTDKKPAEADFPRLHLIDGSASSSSYAAIARRGSIFLGIRLAGLVDGAQLGAPGRSYLHVRICSARNQALAERLDHKHGAVNVVNLFEQNLALDKAWPDFVFEKVDQARASLLVGLFIEGSLTDDTLAVVARITAANLFLKLAEYAIGCAGAEYGIAPATVVATWLARQARPVLDGLTKTAQCQQAVLAAQKEFGEVVGDQLEAAGVHLQQLQAIYQKHVAAQAKGGSA